MSLAAQHSPDGETRQGSFRADPDDLKTLGLPEPRIFAVPANTLVVADTFGFHARGPSADSIGEPADEATIAEKTATGGTGN